MTSGAIARTSTYHLALMRLADVVERHSPIMLTAEEQPAQLIGTYRALLNAHASTRFRVAASLAEWTSEAGSLTKGQACAR